MRDDTLSSLVNHSYGVNNTPIQAGFFTLELQKLMMCHRQTGGAISP